MSNDTSVIEGLTAMVVILLAALVGTFLLADFLDINSDYVFAAIGKCESNGGLEAIDRRGYDCMNGARFRHEAE